MPKSGRGSELRRSSPSVYTGLKCGFLNRTVESVEITTNSALATPRNEVHVMSPTRRPLPGGLSTASGIYDPVSPNPKTRVTSTFFRPGLILA